MKIYATTYVPINGERYAEIADSVYIKESTFKGTDSGSQESSNHKNNDSGQAESPTGKRYVYKAVAAVPDDVDLSSLSIKDKILPEVQNIKDVTVYDDDDSGKDVTSQGKLDVNKNTGEVEWSAKDPKVWHGKHLRMLIGTTLINTPKLQDYLNKDTNKIEVPNTAHLIFNGKDQPSNKTEVTPKTPNVSVDKKIEVNSDGTQEDVDPTGHGDQNKNTDKEDARKKTKKKPDLKASFLYRLFNKNKCCTK